MGVHTDYARGCAKRFSKFDELPMKNSLPPLVDLEFHTGRQWHDMGYELLHSAEPVEMHPTALTRRTCVYYHRDDAVKRGGCR